VPGNRRAPVPYPIPLFKTEDCHKPSADGVRRRAALFIAELQAKKSPSQGMGKDYTQQFFTLFRGKRLFKNQWLDLKHSEHVIHRRRWRL